jgi:hypothetical protein
MDELSKRLKADRGELSHKAYAANFGVTAAAEMAWEKGAKPRPKMLATIMKHLDRDKTACRPIAAPSSTLTELIAALSAKIAREIPGATASISILIK